MSNNEVKLNVTTDNEEIVVRLGEALPLQHPKKIDIKGDIFAPSNWVQSKNINPENCHAIINVVEKKIEIFIDEKDPFGTHITGILEENPELIEMGINSNKRYTQQELSQLIKFKKMFFPDKDRYLKILEQLSNLKGTVVQNFQKANDDKGQQTYLFEQSLKDKFDLNFIISIPVLKYSQKSSFNVDVNYNITDGDVRFWLESVELKEIKHTMVEGTIKEEVEVIKKKIPTIIYA